MVQLPCDCRLFNTLVNNSGYVVSNNTIVNKKKDTRYLKITGAHTAERGRSGNSIDLYEL